jgi:hypothetical protein
MKQASIILREGYRLKFLGEHVLVMMEGMLPYLIPLASIKSGEEIPREGDEPMKWDV